jgi:hypothetical protein
MTPQHPTPDVRNTVKIPGLTTTRIHLLLAALCALSQSVEGWTTVVLLLAVTAARIWARHRHAPHPGPLAAHVGVVVPSTPVSATESRAA